eukprot:gene2332-biopygen3467
MKNPFSIYPVSAGTDGTLSMVPIPNIVLYISLHQCEGGSGRKQNTCTHAQVDVTLQQQTSYCTAQGETTADARRTRAARRNLKKRTRAGRAPDARGAVSPSAPMHNTDLTEVTCARGGGGDAGRPSTDTWQQRTQGGWATPALRWGLSSLAGKLAALPGMRILRGRRGCRPLSQLQTSKDPAGAAVRARERRSLGVVYS